MKRTRLGCLHSLLYGNEIVRLARSRFDILFGSPGHLHPLQEEFKRSGAFQCGFCAPGVTLSAISLLRRNPRPTEEEIREAITGNLCRCSGYVQIIDAIKAYVERTGTAHEEKSL